MLEQFVVWLVDTIGALGYTGIAVLMAIESSIIPLPSELVMPPAGYLAYRGEMNLWLALAAGTFGSVVGAYANYLVAQHVGRWFFLRYGKWLLVTERSLLKAERYFADHGEITTFIGRLLPGIRHLISIPAGLARMRLDRFAIFTAVGAAVWCGVLLAVGWLIGVAGQDPRSGAVIAEYSNRILWIVLPSLVVLVAGYVVWRRRRPALPSEGAGTDAGGGAGG